VRALDVHEKVAFYAAVFWAAVAAFSACSSSTASPVPFVASYPLLRSLDGSGAGKIRHVVYVVQENRSFNDMFEGYPGPIPHAAGEILPAARSD